MKEYGSPNANVKNVERRKQVLNQSLDSGQHHSTLKSETSQYNKININTMQQTELHSIRSQQPVTLQPDYTNIDTIKQRVAMGVNTTESTQM